MALNLSPKDVALLQSIIRKASSNKPSNRMTRDLSDANESQPTAPEVFIAKVPSQGIRGMALGSFVPNGVECQLFKILPPTTSTADPLLIQVGEYTRFIYNISQTDVAGGSWVVVWREKTGQWVTIGVGETDDPPDHRLPCCDVNWPDNVCVRFVAGSGAFARISETTTGTDSPETFQTTAIKNESLDYPGWEFSYETADGLFFIDGILRCRPDFTGLYFFGKARGKSPVPSGTGTSSIYCGCLIKTDEQGPYTDEVIGYNQILMFSEAEVLETLRLEVECGSLTIYITEDCEAEVCSEPVLPECATFYIPEVLVESWYGGGSMYFPPQCIRLNKTSPFTMESGPVKVRTAGANAFLVPDPGTTSIAIEEAGVYNISITKLLYPSPENPSECVVGVTFSYTLGSLVSSPSCPTLINVSFGIVIPGVTCYWNNTTEPLRGGMNLFTGGVMTGGGFGWMYPTVSYAPPSSGGIIGSQPGDIASAAGPQGSILIIPDCETDCEFIDPNTGTGTGTGTFDPEDEWYCYSRRTTVADPDTEVERDCLMVLGGPLYIPVGDGTTWVRLTGTPQPTYVDCVANCPTGDGEPTCLATEYCVNDVTLTRDGTTFYWLPPTGTYPQMNYGGGEWYVYLDATTFYSAGSTPSLWDGCGTRTFTRGSSGGGPTTLDVVEGACSGTGTGTGPGGGGCDNDNYCTTGYDTLSRISADSWKDSGDIVLLTRTGLVWRADFNAGEYIYQSDSDWDGCGSMTFTLTEEGFGDPGMTPATRTFIEGVC